MRRGTVLVLVTFVTAAAAVAGWWFGGSLTSRNDVAAATQVPEPSLITAPVMVGRVERSVSVRATLKPARSVAVATDVPDLGFIPALSYVPQRGDRLVEGDVLYAVAGSPVIALEGDLPMLRDATLRTSGEDIRQLQQALGRLGVYAGDVDGVYGIETALAVAQLIRAAGYIPTPLTGAVAPSDPTDLADQPLVAAQLPVWAVAFFDRLPATVGAATVRRGDVATGGTITLEYGETQLVGSIAADEAGLVQEGTAATVIDDSGTEHPAVVARVADEPGTGSAPPDEYEFRVAPLDPLPIEPGANVLVRLVAEASDDEALSVPYAALTTRADGSVVVLVDPGGGEPVEVPVSIGVEGDAGVEVVPETGGLSAGDEVVVGGS